MKLCPECRRHYYDESLLYCLDDGSALLDGPGSAGGPETAILHETTPPNEAATRAQIYTTEPTSVSPVISPVVARSKTFDKRALFAPLAIAVIVVSGYFGYRYLTPGPSRQITSVAVLPFQNRSDDADTDYLSDGLAESLIFRLSQLPGLKVSPTSSVMRYKGRETDVAKIASELGVEAIMTGRFSKRGDNLNITVELVDVRNNRSLWGEQYERKMADLLTTQREIATTITQKLQLKLAGDEIGITKKYTNSNEAYQLYMRGRYSFAKRTKDEMLRSIDYYRQAVKLDPNFALAYARLSEVYGSMPAYPYMSPKEAFPEAKAAAEKALEIDPTLAEAYTFLAYAQVIYDWNWVEGERSFKRAIELDPNNFSGHFRYGQIYLVPVGRFEEGVREITQGLNAEPLDVNMGVSLAWAELVQGHQEIALAQARRTYELEPNHPLARWMLAQVLTDMGKYDEALAITDKWLQEDPTNQLALRDAGFAYAKSGRRDKAEEIIRRYRELANTQWVPTGRIAAIYGALGEKDKAFAELEKAFEERDWDMFRINTEVYMRPLRDDPRFATFLRRQNLPG